MSTGVQAKNSVGYGNKEEKGREDDPPKKVLLGKEASSDDLMMVREEKEIPGGEWGLEMRFKGLAEMVMVGFRAGYQPRRCLHREQGEYGFGCTVSGE